MAEKRMFSKQIIDSDAFLEMPLSTQALYFHLSMRADDDGFLNNAKKVMKIIGANQNDYDLLVAKSFVIQFPDGICVIKHWRINNYLRKDRYTETIYQEEKARLTVKPNGRYSLRNAAESCVLLTAYIPNKLLNILFGVYCYVVCPEEVHLFHWNPSLLLPKDHIHNFVIR
jgi:hypothetical protein